MQKLVDILTRTIDPTKAKEHAPPSSNPPSNSAMALMNDSQGRKELSGILAQCFDGLKVYGKEPEQMRSTNAMFQLVLADYAIDKIREAFIFYLKFNSEMPAPADIAQIIERGNKPPFDKAVYVSISKKYGEDRSREEWQYMREYERFITSGRN